MACLLRGIRPQAFGLQHLAVGFGFALECQGIGAAAAGHAIQAHGALVESEVDPSAYGWFAQAEMLAERCGGFLSGGDYCPALGQLAQEGRHVGFLNNFKKFVGGIVLQTVDCGGGVVEGDAYAAQKCFDLGLAEFALGGVDKVVAVGKIKMAENAPHVVLHVGVEELHRPPFDRRRKTAQHEYTRRGGQKGLKRMSFHIIGVALRGSAEGWAGMIRQRTRSGELIRRMSLVCPTRFACSTISLFHFFCAEGTCLEMPFNKGYAEKIDVMIFYDLRYQNPKKIGFRNFTL